MARMNLLRPSSSLRGAAVALSMLVVACTAPASGVVDPPAAPAHRLIVVTVSEWPVADALAQRVAAVAGVPVVDVRRIAPRQFVLSLSCADAAACSAAQERLSAEPNFLVGMQQDQRRYIPGRPTPSTAQ